MRHRRDYADVSGLQGKSSEVGFLGTPRFPSVIALLQSGCVLAGAFCVWVFVTEQV